MTINDIIGYAAYYNCSDIHLTADERPVLRRLGKLIRPYEETTPAELIMSLSPLPAPQTGEPWHDQDFALSLMGRRQRVNIFRQDGRPAAAIRMLSDVIPTLEELALPPVVRSLAEEPKGLVLVTGPTGSGKSTTLAAMIRHIMETRACHIITIEDPVEYVYRSANSLVHQREIGRDSVSFAASLRSALREDPDVILVGEMRDLETISAAVTAAETGHLVLSTLHTTGAARTVDRIIDVFPAEARGQIRSQLGGNLRGVITQLLLPLADGSGRVAATEIMIGTDAVSNLIRESKAHQLGSVIQSGAAHGMHTMESCLADYVRRGLITRETAIRSTANPTEFNQMMQR